MIMIKIMVDIQKTIHSKALCEDIFGHHTFSIVYLRIALHSILIDDDLSMIFSLEKGSP